MTTVYLMRHSSQFKKEVYYSNDNVDLRNEKRILSIDGERLAEDVFSDSLFDNVNVIYTSNYVRAESTAKYLAERLNLGINVVDDLGERVHGVYSYSELPEDYEKRQINDKEYKVGYGENQQEVRDRMYKTIMKIVNDNKGKEIVIVSHATAIIFFLMTWCNANMNDKLKVTYKNKVILEGPPHNCCTFKLDFDDNNNLIDINLVK